MDVLRTQSPKIARKEIWAHLLAYNLIRAVIVQSALGHGVLPRTLSFPGAVQTIQAFSVYLGLAGPARLGDLYCTRLAATAGQRLRDRPNRSESRACKRRPKSYPYLTTPRSEYKKRLLKTSPA